MLHNSNKETILKEEIQENTLAIYLEDEQINYIPEKDSGYTLDLTKSSCTNGVTIGFDYNTWSVKTNYSNYTNPDNTRVKCSLYFKKRTFAESLVDCGALSKDAGTCIKENYHLTEEVVDDETIDNNLRFIGANPENYVWFNEELWRIIGVMNNIDDDTGKKETRLKIIRDEAIGKYSWDYDSSGFYDNDWTNSQLMTLLNSGAYYNKATGIYYNGSTIPINVDFTFIGLTSEAKSMISNAIWHLGTNNPYNDINMHTLYQNERSLEMNMNKPVTWVGKIGLMYPSDYGFATSGGELGRDQCLSYPMYTWDSHSDCYTKDWLYKNDIYQWTMTPYTDDNTLVLYIYNTGGVYGSLGYSLENAVLPVIYLNSNIAIIDGDGSESNPFILEI